ncbi:MAG TPA: hypothetical protein VEL73_09095 [Mycobacteriales bacterium]|nr:hypothetical protein [Mycobacteriales bacterium]
MPGTVTARVRLRRRLRWVSRLAVVSAVAAVASGLVVVARPVTPPGAAPPASAAPTPPPLRLTATGSPTSPVVWRVKRAGSPAVDEVIRAYQRYLGTVVLLTEDPDPDDPALPQVAAEPRLGQLRRLLSAAVAAQSTSSGPVVASAAVLSARPGEVTLLGCADYSGQRTVMAGRTGPVAGAVAVARTVVMRREDGVWKAAVSTSLPPSRCRP